MTTDRTDETAIHELVARVQAAWNAHDSAGFAAFFAEDADFIDILGAYHRGRMVIEIGHRHILDSIYKGSRVHYEVERIRHVRPDVAIAFLRARLNLAPADTPAAIQARPTMVLSRSGERWEVVAFQNTKIDERLEQMAADRTDPRVP